MGIFSREKFLLINIETKETVFEDKEFIAQKTVLEEIEKENLSPGLYRVECWKGGRKIRNEWVMRKARKKETAEEAAAKGREEAEAFMLSDALDIKDRVEKHNAFKSKVVEMYGIEGVGNVDKIQIPAGKSGSLGILEAAQIATAQSVFRGISETKPTEVSEAFKSIMNSGTTILAGVAQLFATKITEAGKNKEKPLEKKEVPEKKVETPKPKEIETKSEKLEEGVTKTTFGGLDTSAPSYPYQHTDDTSGGSDTPKLPVTYEEYKRDILGSTEEELEGDLETE